MVTPTLPSLHKGTAIRRSPLLCPVLNHVVDDVQYLAANGSD